MTKIYKKYILNRTYESEEITMFEKLFGKKENAKGMVVTKDTVIGDILDMDQETAPYFLEIGMHGLGCPASRGESLEEACAVHGVDCDQLVNRLNEHFGNQ